MADRSRIWTTSASGPAREFDGDSRALAWRTLNRGSAPKQPGPLADSLQPEVSLADLIRVKANPPVLDVRAEPFVLLGQFHAHPLALAVAHGIGQRLLHNTKQRVFQKRGEVGAGLKTAAFSG